MARGGYGLAAHVVNDGLPVRDNAGMVASRRTKKKVGSSRRGAASPRLSAEAGLYRRWMYRASAGGSRMR